MQQLNYTTEKYPLEKATTDAAAYDLYCLEDTELHPRVSTTVHTGIKVAIPKGYCGVVQVRSSVGRSGIYLTTGFGLIDADYRGEILLAMSSRVEAMRLKAGQRVAQLMILPLPSMAVAAVHSLEDTEEKEAIEERIDTLVANAEESSELECIDTMLGHFRTRLQIHNESPEEIMREFFREHQQAWPV